MIYLELLCICLIIVFVTDCTDFKDSVKKWFSYVVSRGKFVKTEYKAHLIDCSLCQTHWICLIYALVVGEFSLMVWAYICLLAFMTPILGTILNYVRDLLGSLLNWLYTKTVK